MTSPAVRRVLAQILQQPAHPMHLAGCLPLTESGEDLRRSLRALRWLAVLGLPAESVERQRSALQRVLNTLEMRAAEADAGGPVETVAIDGVGPVRFSTATAASRSFLELSGPDRKDYEPGMVRFLAEAGRQGLVVADVGAHVGFFTTIVGRAGGIVVGFEMHPDLQQEIRRNIALNRLERAHVVNAAVGDHDGLLFNLRFNPTPGLRVNDSVTAPPPDAYRKVLFDPVMCVRLDTAFGRAGLVPDLVKLDIEGYEIDALRGAAGLIAGGRTRFLVEFHPAVIGDFGHRPEDLPACFPQDWTTELLEDDGSLRPLTDADRRLFSDPPPVNAKLLFSPPALSSRSGR